MSAPKLTKKTVLLQKLAFAAVKPVGVPAVSNIAISGKVTGALDTFVQRVLPVVKWANPEARVVVEANANAPGKLVVDGRVVEGAKTLEALTKQAFGVRLHVGPLPAAAKKKQTVARSTAAAAAAPVEEAAVAAEEGAAAAAAPPA